MSYEHRWYVQVPDDSGGYNYLLMFNSETEAREASREIPGAGEPISAARIDD